MKQSNVEMEAAQVEMKQLDEEIDSSKIELSGCDEETEASEYWYRVPELTAAEYAAEAIEWDRIRHGLKDPRFEVVQGLGCRRVLGYLPGREDLGVRDHCHVSFYAKPTNSNSNCSNEEKLLIFAELGDSGYKQFRLDYLWVSKPDDPEITFGCGFCPPEKEYPHPIATDADHYHTAQIVYPCPESTKQQELAKLFQPKAKNHQKDGKVVGRIRIRTVYDFKELDQCSFSPELSDREYAEHALKCINMKEDVGFELVDTLGAKRQLLLMLPDGYSHWCHVCFTAKPKNGDHDASLATFFVELQDPAVEEFRLCTYNKFMDGDKIQQGCGICPQNEKFPHPPTISYKAERAARDRYVVECKQAVRDRESGASKVRDPGSWWYEVFLARSPGL
ncbi:uncharacterized protein [Euphorbia lathyris]|uniref:uncharacterized protein isoform X2 n=1 Tax=Euphorbia lathyris TaxID=212925 RepID=UPI0033142EB2